jgi:single-strand DNA-binding protein
MYSKTVLVGYLGKEPEMRYMPSGMAVTNFSMATNNTYTNKDGEKVDETTWWSVSVFGGQAEACSKYLAKGSLVLVEGRIKPDESGSPRIWKGQDGEAHTSFEIVSSTVRFLSKSTGGSQRPVEPEEFEFD